MHEDGVALPGVGELAGGIARQVSRTPQCAHGIRQAIRTLDCGCSTLLIEHGAIDHANRDALELQRIGRPAGGRLNTLRCALLGWQ